MKGKDWIIIGAGALLMLLIMKKAKAIQIPSEIYEPAYGYVPPMLPPVEFSWESRIMSYRDMMLGEGLRRNVEPALIAAIIQRESSGDPNARRYEENVQDYSYGLMQIRSDTAKWRGYTGDPSDLLDPGTNIYWGTEYLSYQLNRYKNVSDAVSAYNAGSVKRTKSGAYINQSYVDYVLSLIPRYRELFRWYYPGYDKYFPAF